MSLPSKIHDPELGEVEWIFPNTPDSEVRRINAEVASKITIAQGEDTLS